MRPVPPSTALGTLRAALGSLSPIVQTRPTPVHAREHQSPQRSSVRNFKAKKIFRTILRVFFKTKKLHNAIFINFYSFKNRIDATCTYRKPEPSTGEKRGVGTREPPQRPFSKNRERASQTATQQRCARYCRRSAQSTFIFSPISICRLG